MSSIENDKQDSEMQSGITVSENQYYGGDWPEYENSMLKDEMKVPCMSLCGENDASSARLDKMFDDMVADSQSNCTDQSDLGRSKYRKHDYPQSVYWNKLDETSHFMVSNADQTEATMDTKCYSCGHIKFSPSASSAMGLPREFHEQCRASLELEYLK
ncbi:hypothetical protein MKW94_017357, partial [Papaver nudicaule]|nr:hypothetical protein [Papaver nudicaule]